MPPPIFNIWVKCFSDYTRTPPPCQPAAGAGKKTPGPAGWARQELAAAGQALGRVCALPTVACPPAIPIAVSGEAIGPAAVELFRLYGVEQVAVTTE